MIKIYEDSEIAGVLTIRAYEKGVIQALLDSGSPLPEAMAMARPKSEVSVHNLVTDVGKELIANLLTGKELIGISFLALGTGTTPAAVGNTQLETEVVRKPIDVKMVFVDTVILSVYIMSIDCAYFIHEIGFFGSLASPTPNSGTLFSRVLSDFDNSAGNTDLTFEYTLTIS